MKLFAQAICLCGMVLLAAPAIAPASTLVLKNGGRVTGEITNPQEKPRKLYQIRTSTGANISIAADQVAQVLDPKNALPQYEEWLTKMPPTAAGNWKMADLCKGQELFEERLHHLRKVIELDPNHAEAREILGYKKNANGGWENPDEAWTSLGYQKVGSKFLTKHHIELEKQQEAIEALKDRFKKELNSLNNKAKIEKHREQALSEIRAIEDPVALDMMTFLFLSPSKGAVPKNNLPSPEIKKVYMGVVAKKLTPYRVGALVHISLFDPADNLRDYALQQLVEAKHPAATGAYLAHIATGIKEYNKELVNRSARALGQLNAQEAVFPLIAALTMKIRMQSGGNSQGIGATPMFDQNGGAGISAGGKQAIIEETHPNPEVLATLQRLTKQNFDYDQQAWKRWYITSNTPNASSMRRDD